MSPLGVAATVLALCYLATTLMFQFRPLSTRYAGLDRVGAIPRWKFFTQGNGAYDVVVEVRDLQSDGALGTSTPIAIHPRRRWWNALWHPQRYRAGVLWLAIAALERRAAAGRGAGPDTSRAYAMILNHCRSVASDRGGQAWQFAVVRVAVGENVRAVTFTSGFHTS